MKNENKFRYCPNCRVRMKKINHSEYDFDRIYEKEWECKNCDFIYGEGL